MLETNEAALHLIHPQTLTTSSHITDICHNFFSWKTIFYTHTVHSCFFELHMSSLCKLPLWYQLWCLLSLHLMVKAYPAPAWTVQILQNNKIIIWNIVTPGTKYRSQSLDIQKYLQFPFFFFSDFCFSDFCLQLQPRLASNISNC